MKSALLLKLDDSNYPPKKLIELLLKLLSKICLISDFDDQKLTSNGSYLKQILSQKSTYLWDWSKKIGGPLIMNQLKIDGIF